MTRVMYCGVMPLISPVVDTQVSQVLLAGSNDFGQVFKHGYASDGVHAELLKLDLSALKPIKLIDLSHYHCVPLSASFLHIGLYHRHRLTGLVTIIYSYSIIRYLHYCSLCLWHLVYCISFVHRLHCFVLWMITNWSHIATLLVVFLVVLLLLHLVGAMLFKKPEALSFQIGSGWHLQD